MKALFGWKTYICVAVAGAVVLGHSLGYLTDTQENTLLDLCGFGSVAALRSAIANLKG